MANETRLTTEDVRHIAALARVGMTDQEVEQMRDQLSNTLENIDLLGQVDTEGVEPTGHSVDVSTVMREDHAGPSIRREDALANAPRQEGEFVRVRAVLE